MVSICSNQILANGVEIDWLPTYKLPFVVVFETRLRIMFKQIIENSIEAINQGSKEKREIKITTNIKNEHVCVEILDTGPGVPNELKLKVFEPFFSTKPKSKNNRGMGLAIVQDIINEHSGLVEINTDMSNGCKVIILLPASTY